jgi:hypothetical protein
MVQCPGVVPGSLICTSFQTNGSRVSGQSLLAALSSLIATAIIYQHRDHDRHATCLCTAVLHVHVIELAEI